MTTDYTWLVATAAEYLNRADAHASIPTFIALTEAVLNRRLVDAGVPAAISRDTLAVATELVAAPADLGVLMNAAIYDPSAQLWLPLEMVTPFGLEVLRGGRESVATRPDRVALLGANLQFSPVPDVSYQVNVDYLANIPALSLAAPTNWVIAGYPDVYLYGVLSQTAGYYPDMADDARVPKWRNLFDAACADTLLTERAKRGPMWTPAFRASDAPPNYGRRSLNFNIRAGW